MNWRALVGALAVLAVCGCGGSAMEFKELEHMRIPLPLRGSIGEGPICTVSEVSVSTGSRYQSASVAIAGKENSKRHPEMESDEEFLTNCSVEQFGSIAFQTKRAGKTAYWADGKEIGGSGGDRYVPVFVKTWEWEAIREMAKDNKFVLHFWTRNTFFADAEVTLTGVENCRSDGKKTEVTFTLEMEKTLGQSWESNVIIPKVFCPMEIVVKPKGKEAIRFLFYNRVEDGGRVNLLLSSCPLPETFTRPRAIISQDGQVETRRWPATFRAPENMPALFR